MQTKTHLKTSVNIRDKSPMTVQLGRERSARFLYFVRGFFCTCCALRALVSASSCCRLRMQSSQTRNFPPRSAPCFSLLILNSEMGFCSLHRLFAQVHIPGVRRPLVHSLQQYAAEPSANSHMFGSKSFRVLALLHFPQRLLSQSSQTASPSTSGHCALE